MLLFCPKTHTSIDKKVPTIPIAPRASIELLSMFPIIKVSVIESIGSAIPEITAGIASLCI